MSFHIRQKRPYSGQQTIRLVPVRAVSAVRQFHSACLGNGALDGVKLVHRSVFVIDTLHQEQWSREGPEFFADVEASKCFAEPDIVPLPECIVDVPVVASEPLSQAVRGVRRCLVKLPRLVNRAQ